MDAMDKTELIQKLIKGSIQRAILESVAALVVIIAFTHQLQQATIGRPRYFGCLIILIASVFIVGVVWSFALSRRLLQVHPATDTAFWRDTCLAQARLLRLVPVWYLAPICSGILVWAAPSGPGEFRVFLVMLAVVVVLFIGVTWLNRHAAAKLEESAQAIAA